MSGIDVIVEDLTEHPRCPHGPTVLFSRRNNEEKRNFFACSACRDRKLCTFFMYEDEKNKMKNEKLWGNECKNYTKGINHHKLFILLHKIKQLPQSERAFCHTCSSFEDSKYWNKHSEHRLVKNISNEEINNPSAFLSPLEDTKKEAQFLFGQNSVEKIINILEELKFFNIINMGTPRLHEFIRNKKEGKMTSLLLDLDKRYHHFFGPMEFCWYNAFNHHFFFQEAKEIFNEFLTDSDCLVLDPPFGGRVELLAQTITAINQQWQKIHNTNKQLPIFWVFPYFMEPQILNRLPDFTMLDYKVDYDNHPLFQDGVKGRKFGSPVRIFTNVKASKIILPVEEGYKFCKECKRWVAQENQHCKLCKACTSKDGRTYIHCVKCERCVKPSWKHCNKCNRCTQPEHKCTNFEFTQECFHCKELGHKKRDCPQVDRHKLLEKRKLKVANAKSKKIKNS